MNNTGIIEIETERLILRNYRIEDFEDYWEYVQMPNVGPRCGWPAYTDKEKAKERLKIESTKPCAGIVCKITKQEYKNNSIYQDFQIKITKDVSDKEKEL